MLWKQGTNFVFIFACQYIEYSFLFMIRKFIRIVYTAIEGYALFFHNKQLIKYYSRTNQILFQQNCYRTYFNNY